MRTVNLLPVGVCLSLLRYGFDSLLLLFFFFQAEDGIRDLIVTGVQTCALPISADRDPHLARPRLETRPLARCRAWCPACGAKTRTHPASVPAFQAGLRQGN